MNLDGMRCALVLPSLAASKGFSGITGFDSAGFDHFAISLFASRPGQMLCEFQFDYFVAAGLPLWESRMRFPGLASARRHRVPCMFDSLRVRVPYPT